MSPAQKRAVSITLSDKPGITRDFPDHLKFLEERGYAFYGIALPWVHPLKRIPKFLKLAPFLRGADVILTSDLTALPIEMVIAQGQVVAEAGRRTLERILLGIPKIGTLYRMYHSSVFSRTLSVLLSGGMPALQALEVIQRTTPSERMKLRLVAVAEMVRSGSSLHLALEQSRILDPLAVEMVRVGEQSSALAEMLDHVADFFDQEVEKATTAVTGLIGPVLILVMGVLVLGLLMAIYVPLFSSSQVVH